MRHDFISTSNTTHPQIKNGAFAPVVEGGYGIFYVLLKDLLIVNLSSYSGGEQEAKILAGNFEYALQELRAIAFTIM